MRVVFVYGYKHTYLEGNLTVCNLDKQQCSVPPGAYDFSHRGLIARFIAQIHSYGAGIKSNQEQLVAPRVMVPLLHMDTPCWSYSSQGL